MGISTKLYRERKAQGLCCGCGKKLDATETHTRCAECRAKERAKNQETRNWYLANKICPECRKEKLFGNEKRCPECRAKRAEEAEKWRQSHKEQNSRRIIARAKVRYHERIDAGLCYHCGKRPFVDGLHVCGICREKLRIQRNARR